MCLGHTMNVLNWDSVYHFQWLDYQRPAVVLIAENNGCWCKFANAETDLMNKTTTRTHDRD